jgi:prepilin-type N-terminal cleavage/methylation domain-containing protein/prepilin-type processing-associated H-X9-DG protein
MITCSKYRGFTLIELLVVVAIIAVLIAILLPALHSARENARGAICMTNMKAQANAVMMYETDWGKYPPVYWGDPMNWPYDCTPWANFIYSILNGGAKVRTMTTLSYLDAQTIVPASKIFQCPSKPYDASQQYKTLPYAYSDLKHQVGDDIPANFRKTSHWLRPSSFTHSPSVLRMLCDSYKFYSHYCPFPTCSPNGYEYGADIPDMYRHKDGLNVGYWDGHVAKMAKTDFESPSSLEMHGHNGI